MRLYKPEEAGTDSDALVDCFLQACWSFSFCRNPFFAFSSFWLFLPRELLPFAGQHEFCLATPILIQSSLLLLWCPAPSPNNLCSRSYCVPFSHWSSSQHQTNVAQSDDWSSWEGVKGRVREKRSLAKWLSWVSLYGHYIQCPRASVQLIQDIIICVIHCMILWYQLCI